MAPHQSPTSSSFWILLVWVLGSLIAAHGSDQDRKKQTPSRVLFGKHAFFIETIYSNHFFILVCYRIRTFTAHIFHKLFGMSFCVLDHVLFSGTVLLILYRLFGIFATFPEHSSQRDTYCQIDDYVSQTFIKRSYKKSHIRYCVLVFPTNIDIIQKCLRLRSST